jgi:hypothetical protein
MLTNTLIAFGITLLLAPESRARALALKQRLNIGQSPIINSTHPKS